MNQLFTIDLLKERTMKLVSENELTQVSGTYYRPKKEIPQLATDAVERFIEMNEDSVSYAEVFADLKYKSELFAEMIKNERLKSLVIEEIDASAEFDRGGAKVLKVGELFEIGKSSTGDRYDYSHDEVWKGFAEKEEILLKQVKELADLRKEREAFLKVLSKQEYSSVNGKTATVDEETGEQVKGARLISPAKPIVRVKF